MCKRASPTRRSGPGRRSVGAAGASVIALMGGAAAAHGNAASVVLQESALRNEERAAPDEAPSAGPLVPLDAALKLNGRFVATLSVRVSMDGRYAELGAEALRDALLPLLGDEVGASLTEVSAGRETLTLEEASVPGLAVAFDPFGLEVRAEVRAADLGVVPIAVRGGSRVPDPANFDQPEGIALGVGIAVEQAFQHYGEVGAEPLRAVLEGSLNVGGFDGVTVTGGAVRAGDRWERLPILAIHDRFGSALRVAGGEVVPLTAGFQRSPRLLGVGVFRAYASIRPFEIIRQTGRQSFVLEQDAEARVYANGALAETLDLPAGTYEVTDFPLAGGANEVRIEVTDTSGGVSTFGFDLFSDAQLLGQGVTEFGLFAGMPEEGRLTYADDLAVTGFVRRGVARSLTLGLNGQAGARGAMAGVNARFGGALGFVELRGAASTRGDSAETAPIAGEALPKSGAAGSVDIRRSLAFGQQMARLTGNVTYRTAGFSDAFARDVADPFRWNAAMRASFDLPAGFGAAVGGAYLRGGAALEPGITPETWSADASLFKSFGDVRIGATYGVRDTGEEALDHRLTLTLSARPGSRWSTNARYDSASETTSLDARRLGREELGNLSGSVLLTDRPGAFEARGDAVYVHNRARLEVRHDHAFADGGPETAQNAGRTTMRAASFVGFAGGRLGIGRPANAGFVVAPVHRSLKESRVEILNGERVVAKSGPLGPPLLPLDRSYSVNRFSLSVDPLPVGYDLGAGTILTFPAPGGGYALPIGSDASRIALGFLAGPDGPVALTAGTIRPAGGPDDAGRTFFTNRGGRFVADGLAPGRYDVVIDGDVVTRFEVPEDSEGMVDVGTLQTD